VIAETFVLDSSSQNCEEDLTMKIVVDLADLFLADSFASQVVIGLLVGIIAFACGHFWRDTLAPTIQNLTYSGIHISGIWTSDLPSQFVDDSDKGRKIENTLKLDQKGHRVTGTMEKRVTMLGKIAEKPEEFKVTAYIQDTYVVGYVKPKPERLGAMAFVCKVEGDGTKMVGGQAFWDVTRKHIRAVDHRIWDKS
jgi:hypothetical protein